MYLHLILYNLFSVSKRVVATRDIFEKKILTIKYVLKIIKHG